MKWEVSRRSLERMFGKRDAARMRSDVMKRIVVNGFLTIKTLEVGLRVGKFGGEVG